MSTVYVTWLVNFSMNIPMHKAHRKFRFTLLMNIFISYNIFVPFPPDNGSTFDLCLKFSSSF